MVKLNWFFLALLSGIYITGPIVDPDLWWHITSGRWILANQAVPTVDYWNMFGVSKPWRAYSWSSEIIFALLERSWGMQGLLSFKILIAVSLALSLCYCIGKIARDYFFGMLIGTFATLGCFNHFTLRPQSIVWICFIWLIYFAEQYREDPNKRSLVGVFALICIWANSHISTPLGLFAITLWCYESRAWSKMIKLLSVSALALLCTPYLGGELLTFSSKLSHPFKFSSISEFQPANIMQYSTAFLLILFCLAALFLHFKPKAIEFSKIFLALSFTGAALAVVKFLPFALFVLAFVLAKLWAEHSTSQVNNNTGLGNLAEAIFRLKALALNLPAQGIAFVILALIAVNLREVWLSPLAKSRLPVKAVDFIQANKLPAPILNTFGDGGYVMYRFSDATGNPGLLVPIDGRTNVTPEEIFKKHRYALRGTEKWREYLEAVQPATVLWRNESPLISILLMDPSWCRVYQDGVGEDGYSVFVKSSYLDSVLSGGRSSDDCDM